MCSSRHGAWAAVLLALAAGACAEEREDLVRKTIGPAGGLISSHDEVLTIVFQPGALTESHDIVIFPSEEPPLIFGPAYRVKPELELEVNVEVTYRRVLPNNTDGVTVAAIRLDDYTEQMGHWDPLERLSIHETSGAVLASDYELSLYYGLLESGENVDAIDASASDPASYASCAGGSSRPGGICFVATHLSMGDHPIDVALVDVDGDGELDVVTMDADGAFSVRRGEGGGRMGPEQRPSTLGDHEPFVGATTDAARDLLLRAGESIGSDLRRAIGGDLGGSPAEDAAVVDFSEGGVYVLLSEGRELAHDFYPTGPGASDVAAADLTGDGEVDLVVVNSGNDSITVLEKTEDSAWDEAVDFAVAKGPSGIDVGDLDGDGIADIVVSGQTDGIITILLSSS